MRETEIRCKCGKLLGYRAERIQVAAGYIRIECRSCKQSTYVGAKPTEDVKPQAQAA